MPLDRTSIVREETGSIVCEDEGYDLRIVNETHSVCVWERRETARLECGPGWILVNGNQCVLGFKPSLKCPRDFALVGAPRSSDNVLAGLQTSGTIGLGNNIALRNSMGFDDMSQLGGLEASGTTVLSYTGEVDAHTCERTLTAECESGCPNNSTPDAMGNCLAQHKAPLSYVCAEGTMSPGSNLCIVRSVVPATISCSHPTAVLEQDRCAYTEYAPGDCGDTQPCLNIKFSDPIYTCKSTHIMHAHTLDMMHAHTYAHSCEYNPLCRPWRWKTSIE